MAVSYMGSFGALSGPGARVARPAIAANTGSFLGIPPGGLGPSQGGGGRAGAAAAAFAGRSPGASVLLSGGNLEAALSDYQGSTWCTPGSGALLALSAVSIILALRI